MFLTYNLFGFSWNIFLLPLWLYLHPYKSILFSNFTIKDLSLHEIWLIATEKTVTKQFIDRSQFTRYNFFRPAPARMQALMIDFSQLLTRDRPAPDWILPRIVGFLLYRGSILNPTKQKHVSCATSFKNMPSHKKLKVEWKEDQKYNIFKIGLPKLRQTK
jgi:hypothetical protein